ncbi:DoxX family protein [Roseibium salinum]|uniref:DoxX family protein n=1 Tax=Roseibium salinum TaxID=1604349 RepID=A0ABT3QXT4_9HYPH|nr:DoxX family protein [Roseibium sp. DSM 29163]MCX2721717.1 DoxX family protein [Roseibium sp. DSM 29163]
MSFYNKVAPYLQSLLRIVSGLLFLEHGTAKYLGFPPSDFAGTSVMSMGGVAGLVELVAGALIAVGLLTRPAAFLASGTMAAAYFLAHAPQGFHPLLNGGAEAILYCFIFLFLAAAGPGPLSLERLLFGKEKTAGRSWG